MLCFDFQVFTNVVPVLSYIRGEVGARAPNLSAEAYWPNARNPPGEGQGRMVCACVRAANV